MREGGDVGEGEQGEGRRGKEGKGWMGGERDVRKELGGKVERDEREERNKTQVCSKGNYVLKTLISKHDQTLESIRAMTEHLLPLGIGMHHWLFLRELTESLLQASWVRVLYHRVTPEVRGRPRNR